MPIEEWGDLGYMKEGFGLHKREGCSFGRSWLIDEIERS